MELKQMKKLKINDLVVDIEMSIFKKRKVIARVGKILQDSIVLQATDRRDVFIYPHRLNYIDDYDKIDLIKELR